MLNIHQILYSCNLYQIYIFQHSLFTYIFNGIFIQFGFSYFRNINMIFYVIARAICANQSQVKLKYVLKRFLGYLHNLTFLI